MGERLGEPGSKVVEMKEWLVEDVTRRARRCLELGVPREEVIAIIEQEIARREEPRQ